MPQLRVATFNARWGLDHRRNRPFDLVGAARQLDADVLFLAEMWWPDDRDGPAEEVAGALGYAVHRAATAPAALVRGRPHVLRSARRATGTWGIAVLSRLPVRSEERVELRRLPRDPAGRRAALVVTVEVGGAPFTVVGTHLGHLTHGSPLQVRALLPHLPGPDTAAAVVGDLNMWGPVATALFPGWRRAVRSRTWPGRLPHSQIDHILVTPVVTPVGGDRGPYVGSDHRPLWADLRFG